MATVAEAKEKVLSMLTDGMELKVSVQKDNQLVVRFEDQSTAAYIFFTEFGGGDDRQSWVWITAPILRGVPESPELYKWVAIQGTGYPVGCVEAIVQDEGTIFLRYKYVVLADYLDEAELRAGMLIVLGIADKLDDELQEKFGGKRWTDAN